MAAGPLILSRPGKASTGDGPVTASVTVEPESLHTLPHTQYGHFIEHLGMCIKGGIWAEGESEDMLLGGIRWELIEAARSINPSLLRYPGGCFADGYHWQDGIGPRASRPRKKNRAWGRWGPLVGPTDDNHFGTDEFMGFCEAIGAEPMITVNVGSGTAEEAAAWVEYVNGSKDTRWGGERARNGHPDPFRVKYWFVGNEIFGWHEIGHQTPPEYVKTLHAYSEAMRKADPDIKLIAVGSHNPLDPTGNPNRTVLEGAGEIIDYLSIHRYVPNPTAYNNLRFQVAHMKGSKSKSIYYDVIGSLRDMERCVEENVRDINAYSPEGKKVPIAFDEWNLWFYFLEDITLNNYNLRDGVWTASMLNLFHKNAPDIPITNIAQMVNCLGIIASTRKGTFLTPSALAFKLYTECAREELVKSSVDCPPIPHESGLPALDLSATRGNGKLALFMVNRHYCSEIIAECEFKGVRVEAGARRREIHHPNPARYNTFREPEAVRIEERSESFEVVEKGAGSRLSVRLKPHSITCLELGVKD
jgi:alpha-N-arabinofuranosidase